ncbi:hypothetical protein GUITHDRAFT_118093 [Guillardia theta CCMP2712]|uniref:Uncharacterized protein n=1 Tax=Guillardia theta (strain CCMP2712) TaxID=905079 RepID=L1IHI7_GUITC|nr:hypothetical protein GUITHDRAFT_118093 [Guillardia theta CCMP2712]EKX35708.1 hypothetical protein GUITHDRAFT_118093 [Guillardia theta CCMP2712]|eukprot:XP_005822688.1 hypothetical protein GUITHDRAFT_118093 [Guillardia theta CCMP2712]
MKVEREGSDSEAKSKHTTPVSKKHKTDRTPKRRRKEDVEFPSDLMVWFQGKDSSDRTVEHQQSEEQQGMKTLRNV